MRRPPPGARDREAVTSGCEPGARAGAADERPEQQCATDALCRRVERNEVVDIGVSSRFDRTVGRAAARSDDGIGADLLPLPALEFEPGDEAAAAIDLGAGRRGVEHRYTGRAPKRGDAGLEQARRDATMAVLDVDENHRDPAEATLVRQRSRRRDDAPGIVAHAEHLALRHEEGPVVGALVPVRGARKGEAGGDIGQTEPPDRERVRSRHRGPRIWSAC